MSNASSPIVALLSFGTSLVFSSSLDKSTFSSSLRCLLINAVNLTMCVLLGAGAASYFLLPTSYMYSKFSSFNDFNR